MRSSGPIGARESSQMQAITYAHNCLRELTYMHTTAYEKQSFSNPLRDSPPAPQEQSFALTRRRHSKQQLPLSEPVKLSDILSESFPPKEALFPEKCIKIALFPCARLDLCRAGRGQHRCTYMPWSNATIFTAGNLRVDIFSILYDNILWHCNK